MLQHAWKSHSIVALMENSREHEDRLGFSTLSLRVLVWKGFKWWNQSPGPVCGISVCVWLQITICQSARSGLVLSPVPIRAADWETLPHCIRLSIVLDIHLQVIRKMSLVQSYFLPLCLIKETKVTWAGRSGFNRSKHYNKAAEKEKKTHTHTNCSGCRPVSSGSWVGMFNLKKKIYFFF